MDRKNVNFETVLSIDARRYRAMNEAAVDVLDDILHDQFYYTHFSGRTENKSSYLENIRSGKVRYGRAITDAVSMFEYEKTVIMHGHLALDCFSETGQHFLLKNVFTAIWIDCGATWRLAAWASTRSGEI